MDSLGNIQWVDGIEPTGCILGDNLSVDVISDSTFIIASTCYYISFKYDILLAKVHRNGQIIWIKSFGNPEFREYSESVNHTKDGGVIVAGTKVVNGTNAAQIFLAKTDSVGVVEWSKSFDRKDMDHAFDVIEVEDNFFTVGVSGRYSIDSSFGLLLKTNNSGSTVWARGYSEPLNTVTSLISVGNSFLLAGGSTFPESSSSSPEGDLILLNTDSLGNPIWSKQFHFDGHAFAVKIVKSIDNGYIILGFLGNYSPTLNNSQCFILKTDNLGNLQWCKAYGKPSRGHKGGYLEQNLNGDITCMVKYYTSAEVVLAFKTDNNGVGTGVCETPLFPTVLSPSISSINLHLTEYVNNDTSIPVSYIAFVDSFVSVDSCNISPVSIAKTPSLSVKLFPNPSNGVIHIESPVNNFDLEVTNMFGVKVYRETFAQSSVTLNMTLYSKGVYFCSLKKNSTVFYMSKFALY